MIENSVEIKLFELQDLKYRDFHSRLIPTIDIKSIIGVRTPLLRKLAKEMSNSTQAIKFMQELPHKYYDENNLHCFLIENIKNYNIAIDAIDTFLPYIDNWATCDFMRPKIFKKHLPELLAKIKEWIKSSKTYTIRFGIEMLMSFYLDAEFKPEYLEIVANIKSDEYYVKMMIAWCFATALAKQYNEALPYIKNHKLDMWTHNKAIQKAVESFRITNTQKTYLRTLKRKQINLIT
ncbi:MAG: DNA alkylation repair protein [Oscillospiraceae bacterium]